MNLSVSHDFKIPFSNCPQNGSFWQKAQIFNLNFDVFSKFKKKSVKIEKNRRL
jgi:hypothetical protein